jgi:dTDP-4-amino-4,6-dideoxygalactose transaminase
MVSMQARVPSRLSALHVPFLRTRLRYLPKRVAGRARQWRRYDEGLKGLSGARLLQHAPGVSPAFRNCMLITTHKQAIFDDCRRAGLPIESIYPASLAFVQRLAAQGWVLPNALELAANNLSLPIGRQMSDRRIDQLIGIVRRRHGA